MHYSKKDLAVLNPDLTPEVIDRIDDIIDCHKRKPGSLIPVLEECQLATGYLPVELQNYIATGLNIPGSTVYGVVTFYSFFSMVPKARHPIKVCMGTACYVRRVNEILNRIQSNYNLEMGGTTDDRRFSLEAVRCLGACGLAPVIVVDESIYGSATPEGILDALEKYE